eukprot:3577450-Prymnesium_polylepis.1
MSAVYPDCERAVAGGGSTRQNRTCAPPPERRPVREQKACGSGGAAPASSRVCRLPIHFFVREYEGLDAPFAHAPTRGSASKQASELPGAGRHTQPRVPDVRVPRPVDP